MKKKLSGFLFAGVLLSFLGTGCTPTVVGNVGYNPGTGDINANVGFEFREIILDGKLVQQRRPKNSRGAWECVPEKK